MGAVCCSTAMADDGKELMFENSPPITPSQRAMNNFAHQKQNMKRSSSMISEKLLAAVQERTDKEKQGVKIQEDHFGEDEESKTIEKPQSFSSLPKNEQPIKKFDELSLDEMRQRLVQSSSLLWKPLLVLHPEARKVTPKIKLEALIADW